MNDLEDGGEFVDEWMNVKLQCSYVNSCVCVCEFDPGADLV